MREIRLPFGRTANGMVSINDVVRGLDCECVCPQCFGMLVACKGGVVRPYFRHHADPEVCIKARETALHLYAAAAASAASMGRFYNCGQACLAIKRVYVFESVADEVIEAVTAKAQRLKVGRGDVKGSQMGPLHTAGQRDEVASQVERTLALGGRLAAGGGPPGDPDLADGFFYVPTVVIDPPLVARL